mgnify:CR=1 FL=1
MSSSHSLGRERPGTGRCHLWCGSTNSPSISSARHHQVGAFASAWFSLCDRLEHFSLATNPIGPKGVASFCENIGPSTLPRLKFLNFFNNQIGDEGLRCIAELLRRTPHHLPNLKTIRITGKNDTTPEGKQVLEEACRARGIKIEG